MSELTKLTAEELLGKIGIPAVINPTNLCAETWAEIVRRLERLEQCEAALRKARTLLISEGDPDEDREMIAEIDELLGDAARAAVEGKC